MFISDIGLKFSFFVASLSGFGIRVMGRILKWFAIPFYSGARFLRTLHHDLCVLGGPTQHGSQSQ